MALQGGGTPQPTRLFWLQQRQIMGSGCTSGSSSRQLTDEVQGANGTLRQGTRVQTKATEVDNNWSRKALALRVTI